MAKEFGDLRDVRSPSSRARDPLLEDKSSKMEGEQLGGEG